MNSWTTSIFLLLSFVFAQQFIHLPHTTSSKQVPFVRPPVHKRTFVSTAIENVIQNITSKMKDKDLAQLFENCFPNTLDTTVEKYSEEGGVPDTFIITGDIKAMWLRDSTNQVWPYLPFIRQDTKLKKLIIGLLNRQVNQVLLDPYANAFYENQVDGINGDHKDDRTYKRGFMNVKIKAMNPLIHERKYELDSLCAVMKLSWGYFEHSAGDLTPFGTNWVAAIKRIMETIIEQQKGTSEDTIEQYTFQRLTYQQHETLHHGKYCSPAKRCGLSKSPFRPSDDACRLPFLVPANAMAVVFLRKVAIILTKLNQHALANDAEKLAKEIDEGIKRFGIITHQSKPIYAYEVDGYGSSIIMDDANIPSLMSLPYLGYISKDDPVYNNTRQLLLSEQNPFFFRGSVSAGIGGPHVGLDFIWPMHLMVQALTSRDDNEIKWCLEQLKNSHAGTGLMHEAFHKDDYYYFTRKWFAWANTLFGELILTIARERPHLIF